MEYFLAPPLLLSSVLSLSLSLSLKGADGEGVDWLAGGDGGSLDEAVDSVNGDDGVVDKEEEEVEEGVEDEEEEEEGGEDVVLLSEERGESSEGDND